MIGDPTRNPVETRNQCSLGRGRGSTEAFRRKDKNLPIKVQLEYKHDCIY